MSRRGIILICAIVAAGAVTAWLIVRHYALRHRLSTIQGAVIRFDTDPRKQAPISDVAVTVVRGTTTAVAHTDASGYFRVEFPQVIWPGETIELQFRNPGYRPLDMRLNMAFRSTSRRLIIASMEPVAVQPPASVAAPGAAPGVVSNIRIRYTVNIESEDNIGSVVKTFEVTNRGNVPCRHSAPCSPGGEWKAATGSATLDAGTGNRFRDARASCIAGPCPFTRIDPISYAEDGRTMTASALNWSDTTTFLVQAEVFHTAVVSSVRQSYPVIYGRTLNFTLPATEEGASIEADINGTSMVFPLGPSLTLSWATCSARTNDHAEKSAVYQCELTPGYRF